MTNLIKIGNVFLNTDRMLAAEDRFPIDKVDKLVVRFGNGETMEFTSREADDLRTWLNSQAVNLQTPTDLSTEG